MSWRSIMGLAETEKYTLAKPVTEPTEPDIVGCVTTLAENEKALQGPETFDAATLEAYREQVGAWMTWPPPFPPPSIQDPETRGHAYAAWWAAVDRLHRWGRVPASLSEHTLP